MAEPSAPLPGVHVQTEHGSVIISDKSVDHVLDTLRLLWGDLLHTADHFLDWMQANPIEFGVLVLLLAFWIWQRNRTKVEIAEMALEYELMRTGGQRNENESNPSVNSAIGATPRASGTS